MDVQAFRATIGALRREMQAVIVGHETLIDHVLIALIANGHVFLEGVPGLGMTLLVTRAAYCAGRKAAPLAAQP